MFAESHCCSPPPASLDSIATFFKQTGGKSVERREQPEEKTVNIYGGASALKNRHSRLANAKSSSFKSVVVNFLFNTKIRSSYQYRNMPATNNGPSLTNCPGFQVFFMLLILIAASHLELNCAVSGHQMTTTSVDTREQDITLDRLWLFEDRGKEPNYVYELNDADGPSSENTNRSAGVTTITGDQLLTGGVQPPVIFSSSINSTNCQPSLGSGGGADLKSSGTTRSGGESGSVLAAASSGSNANDNDTSASILKPSHHRHQQPPQSSSSSSALTDSQGSTSEKRSSDKKKAQHVSKPNAEQHPYSSSSSTTTTNVTKAKADSAKKSKMRFFKGTQKKISLTSLLPKSKRPTNSSSSSSSQQAHPNLEILTDDPSPHSHLFSSHHHPLAHSMLPAAYMANHHHHHHHPSLMLGPPRHLSPPNGALLPEAAHNFFNLPRLPQISQQQQQQTAPSFAGSGGQVLNLSHQQLQHHPHQQQQPQPQLPPTGGNQLTAPVFDQAAAQSMDHYQRIRLTKQNEPIPIFYATGAGGVQNDPPPPQQQPQATRGFISPLGHPRAQPMQHHQANGLGQQQQQAQVAANGMGTASATAVLLAERAKSLMSQMNLGRQLAEKTGLVAASIQGGSNGVRSNGGGGGRAIVQSSSATSSSGNRAASNNNAELAGMIKSAAEAWAATNTGTETTPTIVVEHDGPSITTVDFGNMANGQPVVQSGVDEPPEDDDEAAFYSEEEGNESESEGSSNHEAKLLARLKHQQRHPFEQQQTGHHQQMIHPHSSSSSSSESLDDDFYSQVPGALHRPPGAKDASYHQHQQQHDVANDALQDYMRLQKVIDNNHSQAYPDSINAIKEQSARGSHNNGDTDNGRGSKSNDDLASQLRNTLSSSSNEQIESLIKELRDLNKRRRGGAASRWQSMTTDDERQDKKRLKSLLASLVSLEDYEEGPLSSSSLSGANDDNDDDDELAMDEQTRLLRKKLLARLRSKQERHRRKGGGGGGDSGLASGSSFHNEAVRIPLHALLLAALDRRMSPSEQSQQTVVSQEDLIVDDRSLNVARTAQEDFNEVTSVLGSLMAANRGAVHNPLYTHQQLAPPSAISTDLSTTSVSAGSTRAPPIQGRADDFYASYTRAADHRQPPNNNVSSTFHSSSSPPLHGSSSRNDDSSSRQSNQLLTRMNTLAASPSSNEAGGQSATAAVAASQMNNETSATSIENGSSSGGNDDSNSNNRTTSSPQTETGGLTSRQPEEAYSATTRTPAVVSGQAYHQRGAAYDDEQTTGSGGDGDDGELSSRKDSGGTKGRRDVVAASDDENGGYDSNDAAGDFDVDKQIDQFAQDKNEPPLEPAWARKPQSAEEPRAATGAARMGKIGPGKSVEFDDEDDDQNESEEMAAGSVRRKRKLVLKRRRPPPGSEAGYEESAKNFFKKLHRDTDHSADIDKNTSGIEDPIESPASEEEKEERGASQQSRPPPVVKRQHFDDEYENDDDDGGESNQKRSQQGLKSSSSSSKPDDNDLPPDRQSFEGADDDDEDTKRQKSPEAGPPKATWKPQVIDEEVRKLEEAAAERDDSRKGKSAAVTKFDSSDSSFDPIGEGKGETKDEEGEVSLGTSH